MKDRAAFFENVSPKAPHFMLAATVATGHAHGRRFSGGMDDQETTVGCDDSGAIGPVCFYLCEPVRHEMAEATWHGVRHSPKLVTKTSMTCDRDSTGTAIHCPCLPSEPEVKIENAGRLRERGNNLALDGDAVLVDLVVESFAQSDHVSVGLEIVDEASVTPGVP